MDLLGIEPKLRFLEPFGMALHGHDSTIYHPINTLDSIKALPNYATGPFSRHAGSENITFKPSNTISQIATLDDYTHRL